MHLLCVETFFSIGIKHPAPHRKPDGSWCGAGCFVWIIGWSGACLLAVVLLDVVDEGLVHQVRAASGGVVAAEVPVTRVPWDRCV